MTEYGEILDEHQKDAEDTMVFRLDPRLNQQVEEKKGTDDDPMWASASSAQMGWFFADE